MTDNFIWQAINRSAVVALAAGMIAGCQSVPSGFSQFESVQSVGSVPAASELQPVLPPAEGEIIGTGSVRVALLLPKTAPGNAAAAATAFRNAAALAMQDHAMQSLQLVIKDTAGLPGPATDAAGVAVSENASIVLGPLFAGNVSAASGVVRPSGRVMIAFSSDRSVAAPGIYLQSFLPGAVIERTMSFAASNGVSRVVAILPEGAFGSLAEMEARETLQRTGGELVAVARYAYDDASVDDAVRSVAVSIQTADAVFIPDGGNSPAALIAALQRNGVSLEGKRLLGSGQWATADLANPALTGAWFADVDQAQLSSFKSRYAAAYGSEPPVNAALAYDAVAMVAGIVRTRGRAGLNAAAIENPVGYTGYGGTFRFLRDGSNERAYAVYEVQDGKPAVVSPAPARLGYGGS